MSKIKNVSLLLLLLSFISWKTDNLITCTIDATVYEVDSEYNLIPADATTIKYHKQANNYSVRTADEATDQNGKATFPVTDEPSATISYIAEKPNYTSSRDTKSIAEGDCTIRLNIINLKELRVFERKVENQIEKNKKELAKQEITKFKTYFSNFDQIRAFDHLRKLELKIENQKLAPQDLKPNDHQNGFSPDNPRVINPLIEHHNNPLIKVKPELMDNEKIKEIEKVKELQNLENSVKGNY